MARRNRKGRVFVPDDRDLKYLIKSGASERTSRTWRENWSGDQGYSSQCVAYAWKGVITSSPIVQGKSIDPEELYELCKFKDEWEGENYEGTSVRAGASILKMAGYVSEYRWTYSVDDMIYTILENGPMTIGVNWYAKMDRPDENGLITVGGRLLGGHAVGATACNTKKELFRIKNSWGNEWGDEGNAWLSFSDMQRLLDEDGEACIAKEIKA